MKTSKMLMVLAGGVAAFVLLTGFGPRPGGMGFGWSRDPQERFARAQQMITSRVNAELDELKATPDQRAKILAIKDRLVREAQAQLEQNREQSKADRQWAVRQLLSDRPDAAALHAKLDAKADTFKTMGHKVIDALVEVNAILTPPQRAQLKTRLEQMAASGAEWGPPMHE